MSYLTQRSQCVVNNNQVLSPIIINAGVPQCCVLGPLLFLIFINDIANEVTSFIRLFADDTSLFKVVEPNKEIETAAQIIYD